MKMLSKFSNRGLSYLFLPLMILLTIVGCEEKLIVINSGQLVMTINSDLQTNIASNQQKKPLVIGFKSSESLQLKDKKVDKFLLTSLEKTALEDNLKGTQWTLSGQYSDGITKIEKKVQYRVYDNFEGIITCKVFYTNKAEKAEYLIQWSNNQYQIESQGDDPAFWAFQGESSTARADWIKPLTTGYYQKNYMGMNDSDYGGGIPVTDVWRSDVGVTIGHLALKPQLVSLPTEISLGATNVDIRVTKEFEHPTLLQPGETLETLETFVMVHEGDYYNALALYSKLMQAKGIKMKPSEAASYETIWCSWGYERTFTADEVLGTLPKVKELGIKWAVLDDGFQIAEGDWHANPVKYPKGDIEIKELVEGMHEMGLKAKIWWTPLAVDPGTKAFKDRPQMRLFQRNWAPQYITWWDAYYISPVNQHAINHTKETIDLFMKTWDFDGFKMDGQHMNGVLPDHNPDSKLDYPEQSVESLPDFFQMIYDEARAIKPNAVIENCPCGTCMSYYNMASINQAVASDPTSLWQIRHKGKTYKALIPETAYSADHVELIDTGGNFDINFATGYGIGGVLETKFTWPNDNPNVGHNKYQLTPEKEVVYKKWFGLYDQQMISNQDYLGHLYDIGYDKPETHVIRKENVLYFSFYDTSWSGAVTFKGLITGKEYEIVDYINHTSLGKISEKQPTLDLTFKDYLLVKAIPTK